MEPNNKIYQVPSFPAPYEQFDIEMAADIEILRNLYSEFETTKSKWEQSLKNIENVSPIHPGHKRVEINIVYYQEKMREIEGKIEHFNKKTVGRMERILEVNEEKPEFVNQVLQILDEKIHPENYEEKSIIQDNQSSYEVIEINNNYKEKVNEYLENSADLKDKSYTDNQSKNNSLDLSKSIRQKASEEIDPDRFRLIENHPQENEAEKSKNFEASQNFMAFLRLNSNKLHEIKEEAKDSPTPEVENRFFDNSLNSYWGKGEEELFKKAEPTLNESEKNNTISLSSRFSQTLGYSKALDKIKTDKLSSRDKTEIEKE